jgi:hypothetical protein
VTSAVNYSVALVRKRAEIIKTVAITELTRRTFGETKKHWGGLDCYSGKNMCDFCTLVRLDWLSVDFLAINAWMCRQSKQHTNGYAPLLNLEVPALGHSFGPMTISIASPQLPALLCQPWINVPSIFRVCSALMDLRYTQDILELCASRIIWGRNTFESRLYMTQEQSKASYFKSLLPPCQTQSHPSLSQSLGIPSSS